MVKEHCNNTIAIEQYKKILINHFKHTRIILEEYFSKKALQQLSEGLVDITLLNAEFKNRKITNPDCVSPKAIWDKIKIDWSGYNLRELTFEQYNELSQLSHGHLFLWKEKPNFDIHSVEEIYRLFFRTIFLSMNALKKANIDSKSFPEAQELKELHDKIDDLIMELKVASASAK